MKEFMLRVSGNEENGWGIYLINRYKNTEKIIVPGCSNLSKVEPCSNLSDTLKFCEGLKKILGEMPIVKEEIEKCKNCDGDGSYMHPASTRVRVSCLVCNGKGWIKKE